MPEIVIGRSQPDLKKYGDRVGTAFIGRHVVGEKREAHQANIIRMDIARPHVVGVFGKRGSGKSYTLGVIAEELLNTEPNIKDNISVLLVDTMGLYWSMKDPNDRDAPLLQAWNLKPKGFDLEHFIPLGQAESFRDNNIPFDNTFTLKPSELTSQDWCLAFNININDPTGVLIDRVLRILNEGGKNYSIKDIMSTIESFEGFKKEVREALINRFMMAQDWGLFAQTGIRIEDLTQRGKAAILDVSLYGELAVGWSVRTLIVGLLARRILRERMRARRMEEIQEMEGSEKSEMPIVWMLLDEAHMFVPNDGETPASQPLLQWVKIGREPGVSLVLATQRPNKLHEDVISQSDLIISHRLTSKADIDSLRNIMQTYMRFDLSRYIDNLPRTEGSAICLDDNSERVYALQIRPRLSWHSGGTPIAIKM